MLGGVPKLPILEAFITPDGVLGDYQVRLLVTSFTTPCRTIRNSFLDNHISRIGQKPNPGWSRVYAKVLQGGKVAVGDRVALG